MPSGRYFDAQIGLNNAVRDEHLALVQLYKALGGRLDGGGVIRGGPRANSQRLAWINGRGDTWVVRPIPPVPFLCVASRTPAGRIPSLPFLRRNSLCGSSEGSEMI